MELRHSIFAHQPNETMTRPSSLQAAYRIHGVASAFARFEIADPDEAPPRHLACRGQARGEGGHVLRLGFQRISRRNQPPDFVEAEALHCRKAHPPMRPVSRVEASAE